MQRPLVGPGCPCPVAGRSLRPSMASARSERTSLSPSGLRSFSRPALGARATRTRHSVFEVHPQARAPKKRPPEKDRHFPQNSEKGQALFPAKKDRHFSPKKVRHFSPLFPGKGQALSPAFRKVPKKDRHFPRFSPKKDRHFPLLSPFSKKDRHFFRAFSAFPHRTLAGVCRGGCNVRWWVRVARAPSPDAHFGYPWPPLAPRELRCRPPGCARSLGRLSGHGQPGPGIPFSKCIPRHAASPARAACHPGRPASTLICADEATTPRRPYAIGRPASPVEPGMARRALR